MRLAFRAAARKRQRGPLTSPRRKRYKQTDSPVHRMSNTTNLFNLRVVIFTWFMAVPAFLFPHKKPRKKIGPGSISPTGWHGKVDTIPGQRILQTEYSHWPCAQ